MSQEVSIEITHHSQGSLCQKDSICFIIFNSSTENKWFYINGLFYKMYISDDSGNIIEPFLRIEHLNSGFQDYILLQALHSEKVTYSLNEITKNFKLERGKIYFLHFEYSNLRPKRKTKTHTFEGNIILEPLKFRL
jgi:hypothetical protein